MKKIEFKTSKGEFLLVDDDGKFPRDFPHDFYSKIGYVKNITEEQASDVLGDMKFHNYGSYLPTPKLKLEALLKSKGIHLYENSYEDPCTGKNDKGMLHNSCIDSCQGSCWNFLDYTYEDMEESENITFYNPYLFKKI